MNIITHRVDSYNLDEELKKIRKKIELEIEDSKNNSNYNNNNEKLSLFDQLCEFEFGRWLLVNRGLNAYWSYYLIYNNEINNDESKMHSLEDIMIKRSPGVVAAKERVNLNKVILQNLINNNDNNDITLASIPCGFMNDLLRLDLNIKKNIKLVGVDLDPYAIKEAKKNSQKYHKETITTFKICDAWLIEYENEFDVINSSGLNMYVQNEDDLLKLYRKFYRALKSNGYLIVSSNTPPMDEDNKQVWHVTQTELEYVYLQALIYNEVIKVRQGLHCTEKQIINQLKTVGFNDVKVDYDSRNMFLSFIARK